MIGVEVGGMDTPISRDPDIGQPWCPRFDARALVQEARMLQAACYVVCAYLTGMRDCEVQAMRAGCLSLTRSEDGIIERHSVQSVAYKGNAAQGERAEWITIAPVAAAVSVLERLVVWSTVRRGTGTLWPVLDLARARNNQVSSAIVSHLNEFRDHLNARFGTADAPIIPAGPSGAPWHLTTRQFRRTIAWHIANRPFGTIAGMIQYKHASVAAFEGYVGSSRSGFRAEVETERRLGQIEDILTPFR
jgi:integrase